MATGYEDLIPAKKAASTGYEDLIPQAATPSEVPGPRRAANPLVQFGRGAASLADVVVGDLPAMAIQQVGYPIARVFTSPARASQITQTAAAPFQSPVGKLFGVTQTPEYQQEASRKLMDFIGQNFSQGSKWISEKTGVPEADVANMMGSLALAAPAAVKPVKQGVQRVIESPEIQTAIAPVREAVEARQARIAAERSAESWQRAPQIDAANLAVKYGIALDPAKSNPTAFNRVTAALSGTTELDAKLSARNEIQWVKAAKDAMKLPQETVLSAAAFEKARSLPEITAPYNAVRNIRTTTVPDTAYQALDRLRVEPLYGDQGAAAATNAFVDNIKTQLQQGGNGGKLLDSIKQLRQEAQSIYNTERAGQPITPEMRQRADATMGAARVLESVVESNIPNPKIRAEFAEARKRLAQTYDFESATNLATGKIDPQVLAKMAAEGKPLSGVVGDLAQIAANFPEVSRVGAAPEIRKRLTRSGVGAAVGGVVGGGPLGAAVGGAVGYLTGGLGERRIASPAFQARRAVPADYRQPLPPEVNIPSRENALVPYVATGEVLPPEYVPNWVYGRPSVTPEIPAAPVNRLAAPTFESTIEGIRRQEAQDVNYFRQKEAQQAAAQAAAEAATRRPTSGGILLELDPTTGRLRSVSEGIKGATPETFQNYGATLESATNKISSGQRFSLSAEEKIAWDRTKVDLAQVAPEFKALSDKALAERMLDREWVQQAVIKARQKAAAFEQAAARAKDAQSRRAALANRERMLDAAEQIEDTLRAGRPTSTGQQGPKTQEAIRNRLLGGSNENNLIR